MNPDARASAQQRIRNHAADADSNAFFHLLSGPQLLERVEPLLPEQHRERLFPPIETLSMFLAQALPPDGSCREVVNDAALKRLPTAEQSEGGAGLSAMPVGRLAVLSRGADSYARFLESRKLIPIPGIKNRSGPLTSLAVRSSPPFQKRAARQLPVRH